MPALSAQDQIKRFFNPDPNDPFGLNPQPQQQPNNADQSSGSVQNLQPNNANSPSATATPGVTPSPGPQPTPSQPAVPSQPAPNSGALTRDQFFQQNPHAADAFMPARPVGDFDNSKHPGLRRGLASAFAGLAEMGGEMNYHPGLGMGFVNRWQDQDQAQRMYDANRGRYQAEAQNQAYGGYLGDTAKTSEIARTGTETALAGAQTGKTAAEMALVGAQTKNLSLVGPPGKQDFLKEFVGKVQSGQYDPNQLFNEYAQRGRAFGVTRDELVGLINNTPETPPVFKIGPQGIREPIQYHGRNWYGNEEGAPDIIKSAATNAANVENKVHQNKLQEQSAARSNIVLKNDLANGPLGTSTIPHGTTGEAALQGMDPALAETVRMIGDGKTDFQTFTSRMPTQAKINLAAAVHAYNPNFDQATYAIHKEGERFFSTGAGGSQATAFGTAIGHLDTLDKAGRELDNGNALPFNKLANAMGVQMGSDQATNFNAVKNVVAGEVAKVIKGNATEGEMNTVDKMFSDASSPKQLAGAIKYARELLSTKRDNLQNQRNAAVQGKDVFANQQRPQQHQIGDVVTVKGKKVKITALHPDGSFDGDEVQQ